MTRLPRSHPAIVGGELGALLSRGGSEQQIADTRLRLKVAQAEHALRRVLDEAPPLSRDQIAYLKGVLSQYAVHPKGAA